MVSNGLKALVADGCTLFGCKWRKGRVFCPPFKFGTSGPRCSSPRRLGLQFTCEKPILRVDLSLGGKETTVRKGDPVGESGTSEEGAIEDALDFVRRFLRARGVSLGTASPTRQEKALLAWARHRNRLLSPASALDGLKKGGQEHDIRFDPETGRVLKVTRSGIFGLSPGIELDLVAGGITEKRFHLWEATPLEYLDRLRLQNELVPGIVLLEGVAMDGNGLSVVTSQPALELNPVTQCEIDRWFFGRGFRKVTESGYYREKDNIAVFDAHDKNVVRSGDELIPFDVIPCHPSKDFLSFVRAAASEGTPIRAERTATTSPR